MPDDKGDLGAAFARLQHGLRSYLRGRGVDAALAEDLLQEAFVKALASRRASRQIDNFNGWLFAAIRTTLIDHYRAQRHHIQELDDTLATAEDGEDQRLHEELATCLPALIAELPAIYRDTLKATDLEGKTLRSIAEAQSLSVSAIKSRAARGRLMLKEKLLDCCQVEVSDGLVSHYRCNSYPRCKGSCAV